MKQTPNTMNTSQPPQPKKKSRWLKWLLIVLITPVLLFIAYTWFALTWSYSSGERAGYVQKLSKRGFIVKTWEGELAMVNLPGTTTEKFYFSVREDATAEKINASLGKRVALVYEQHIGVPTNLFGETEYYVIDVRVIE